MYTQYLAPILKRPPDDEFTPTNSQQPGKRDELAAQRKACEQSAQNLYARMIKGEASVGELARHTSLSAQPALSASRYASQLQEHSAKNAASLVALQQAFTPTTGGLPLASPPSFAFSPMAPREPSAAAPHYFQAFDRAASLPQTETLSSLTNSVLAQIPEDHDYRKTAFYIAPDPNTTLLSNQELMRPTTVNYSFEFIRKTSGLSERGNGLPEPHYSSYQKKLATKMGGKYECFCRLTLDSPHWLWEKGHAWLNELDRFSECILRDHIEVVMGWKKELTYKEPQLVPYATAPVKGTWQAAKGLGGMILHPWDRVLKPMAQLVIHPLDSASALIKFLGEHVDYLKDAADGPEAVEMLTHGLLETVAVVKASAALSRVAAQRLAALESKASYPAEFYTTLRAEAQYVDRALTIMRRGDVTEVKRFLDNASTSTTGMKHYLETSGKFSAPTLYQESAIREVELSGAGNYRPLIEKTTSIEQAIAEILNLKRLSLSPHTYYEVPRVVGFTRPPPETLLSFYMTKQPGQTLEEIIGHAAEAHNYAGLDAVFAQTGRAYAELSNSLRCPLPTGYPEKLSSLLTELHELSGKRGQSLGLTNPYTKEEIAALSRKFCEDPGVGSFMPDDPHLGNVLWHPETKRLSCIDIGGHPAKKMFGERGHNARTLEKLTWSAEISFAEHGLPPEVAASLTKALQEGFREVIGPIHSETAAQFHRVLNLYHHLLSDLVETQAATPEIGRLYALLEASKAAS